MRITIISGQRAGESFDLDVGERIVLGREESCDLVIQDEQVSHRHLALTAMADGSVTLEDLGSSNGTFVNGVRIGQPVALRGGDEVRAGLTVLRVGTAGGRRGPSRRLLVAALAAAAIVAGGTAGGLLATCGGDEPEAGPVEVVTETVAPATTGETAPEPEPSEAPPEAVETGIVETETPPPEAEPPSDSLGAALEALLALIPDDHRDTCRPDSTLDDSAGEVISVQCHLPELVVYYTQFDSPETLQAKYRDRLDKSSIAEGAGGDCAEDLPAEGPYRIAGEPAGRLVCWEALGYPNFAWTHDATGIYGLAFHDDDQAALWEWWSSSSGPLETPSDAPETGLGAALDALYASVPDGHRETCSPFYSGDPAEGFVVGLRCAVSPELDVYYSQLDSPESLELSYRKDRGSLESLEDTGDCSQSVPGEHAYTIDGEPAGRVFCREWLEGVELTWTHEARLVNATAFFDGSMATLWEWWVDEAGPIG